MAHTHAITPNSSPIWMVAPVVLQQYLMHARQLMAAPKSNESTPSPKGAFTREVIDAQGNPVNFREEEIPPDSVGVVRQVGAMYKYGSWYHWGTDELLQFAMDFDNHPNIVGQIWQDDSGGGLMSSIAPWLQFLKTKKKPVVALLDMCGSACLYKNIGADHVMAENNLSAMFGSIGVMVHFYDYSKMLQEVGITEHVINSNLSKDKNKSFRLALEGKYDAIKKEMLDPGALAFQDYVKASRPKLAADVPGLLTGKMFYAAEALDYGLIDSIGSLPAAIDRVKFLASARNLITFN